MLGEKMVKKGGRLKSRDLAEAVAAKDLVALKEVQRAGHFLGIGLGSLINLLGPEIVLIGGGVAGALGDSYLEIVRASARTQAITDPQAKIGIERGSIGRRCGDPGGGLAGARAFCADLKFSIQPMSPQNLSPTKNRPLIIDSTTVLGSGTDPALTRS